MNEKLKVWIAGLAGVFGLFAVLRDDVLPVLMALPPLAQAWASGLPLGIWSCVFALIVSMAMWSFANHWLPDRSDGSRPQFAAAMVAFTVAILVVEGQVIGQPISTKVNAAWLGATVGTIAPFLANGVLALLPKKKDATPPSR